jgi:hypothetical protein
MITGVLCETRDGKDEVLAMIVPGHERYRSSEPQSAINAFISLSSFMPNGSKVLIDRITCNDRCTMAPCIRAGTNTLSRT